MSRLTDGGRVAIGRGMVAISFALTLFAVVVDFAFLTLAEMYDRFLFHNGLTIVILGLLAWIMLRTQPRNRAVWVFVWTSIFGAVEIAGDAATARSLTAAQRSTDLAGVGPQGITVTAAIGFWLNYWTWIPGFLPLLTLALLWFPDGRTHGRFWIVTQWLTVLAMATAAAAAAWRARPFGDYDYSELDQVTQLEIVAYGLLGFTVACSLSSVVVRYRKSTGQHRRQFRWIAWGSGSFAAICFIGAVVDIATGPFEIGGPYLTFMSLLALPVLLGGYGIAIWRHRLFDIDLIISRTLIYGSTLAAITGIYVAIVFGLGTLFGQSSDSAVLPVVATAVIALVFHPARVRLERLANRIVFGRRATPYEVLSEFTGRVAATDDELLVDVARSLADATIATSATVWTMHDDRLEPVSVWPERQKEIATTLLRAEEDGHLLVPGADETYPIEHHGEVIGALGLRVPAGESLTPADHGLISELTAGIGLALWNRQLTAELRASVDDLRASRRRLVAIQDETRHSLERDLHDGAQQRLVAVKVRLSIAQQMVAKAGPAERAERLAGLCGEADEAIESLRDFARGVYPPLLEAEGLRAAVDAHANRSRLPIEVRGMVEQRHQREIEATVYFCIVETLALIEGAGTATAVEITLTEEAECLAFEVRASHDGTWPLVLPDAVRDRVEAVDGILASETSVGITSVAGSVPGLAAGSHPAVPGDSGELIDA